MANYKKYIRERKLKEQDETKKKKLARDIFPVPNSYKKKLRQLDADDISPTI